MVQQSRRVDAVASFAHDALENDAVVTIQLLADVAIDAFVTNFVADPTAALLQLRRGIVAETATAFARSRAA